MKIFKETLNVITVLRCLRTMLYGVWMLDVYPRDCSVTLCRPRPALLALAAWDQNTRVHYDLRSFSGRAVFTTTLC